MTPVNSSIASDFTIWMFICIAREETLVTGSCRSRAMFCEMAPPAPNAMRLEIGSSGLFCT